MIVNESNFVYGACHTQTCVLHGVVKYYPTRLVYVYDGKATATTDLAMRCMSCDAFLVPQPKPDPVKQLAESVRDYVATHHRFDVMSKRDCITATVEVMCTDIGLAQDFLKAIGVEVDLYNQEKKPPVMQRDPCSKCGHDNKPGGPGFCA